VADVPLASVLDASALMAVLHDEEGASVVMEAIAAGSAISVANWAEVLSKLTEAGRDPGDAATEIRKAEGSRRTLTIEPVTAADCIVIARLRARDQSAGTLSGGSGVPGAGHSPSAAGVDR
jgi:ribonuclease VapC